MQRLTTGPTLVIDGVLTTKQTTHLVNCSSTLLMQQCSPDRALATLHAWASEAHMTTPHDMNCTNSGSSAIPQVGSKMESTCRRWTGWVKLP